VRNKAGILPAIERVGGAPVIIKLLEGTQGIGVILAETTKVAEAIVETLQVTQQDVLIQRFVAESRGRDLRAIVVGGRVVAAMRRQAQGEEFRSNVHRGGTVESVDLGLDYERAAIQAAQILGLRVAGVDMLESSEGPQVMEVNSSPGLEGIEQATGLDVAGSIVEHLESEALFPDIDLRQRLTLRRGYGVAEVPVPRGSTLKGKTIAESGIRDRGVLVLSIRRGGEELPAPHGGARIVARDVLLCYGPLETLRHLLPPSKRRRVDGAQRASEEGPPLGPTPPGPAT